MKKIILYIMGFLLLLPASSWSESPTHAGYIKTIAGEVSVLRNEEVIQAEIGTRLFNSDSITTGSDSSVGIVFIDNTRLSLGEDTEIDLKEYKFVPVDKDYAFSLYMKKGTALYSSGKLSKLAPEKVDFQTPRATVGVRGTKFLVEVD